jgi:hypothetical protein
MSENALNSPTFFYLLDNCHPLIANLAKSILHNNKPKREWFSDDVNYFYYIRYVRPKLAARDGYYYCYGNDFHKSYTKSLYIAKNYLAIEVKVKISRIGYIDYHNFYIYMVGVDTTTNKLFVNRIPNTVIFDDADCIVLQNLRIIKIDDNKIHEILGYEFDVDNPNECVLLNTPGRYRVQGEIIMRLSKEIDFVKRVVDNFDRDIRDYIIALAQDKIYGVLLELGYNPQISRAGLDVNITVDINLSDKGFEKFVYNVVRGLKKYFDNMGGEVGAKYSHIYVSHPDLGNLIYHFENDKPLRRIRITCQHENVYEPVKGNVYIKTLNEIKNMFENLPRNDFEFLIGEHRIKVKNAYSLRMTYVPNIQPIFMNELRISSHDNRFLVDHNSLIEINHREHGKKVVRFGDSFIIEFDTTNVANTFLMERNKVVNYILAKNKP